MVPFAVFACSKCGIHFERSNDWREHMITHDAADKEGNSQDNQTNRKPVELSTTQPRQSEQDHNNMGIFTNPKRILLSKLMKRMCNHENSFKFQIFFKKLHYNNCVIS